MNFNNIDKQINITQDGKDNTIIITIPSQPTQLQANPFTPPQPREGGLFGGEEELNCMQS
ncbi:hypothetical protein PN497_13840 [Sphaerospermopsis kisseleviana CS-549]|uniref:Uncharacterized protein n=1 Tax=Sphaerospermopsis kisseleviana CS-549 TaxID=3021783 RepID=A0ABT4ZSS2_9CYAN|nr:hypothetical protein [Sphaerospermopsis kisseleviana]MDB9442435.1 hypothetical protein [Sphaerospermopsis kisseleviana CS-549]BAZ79643.1 hypothetical protein NIES73_08880 [Sphaerospermopsis kisseleviana NIES-73]